MIDHGPLRIALCDYEGVALSRYLSAEMNDAQARIEWLFLAEH